MGSVKKGLNYVTMNSRMNSWTLMKILVVPCLFLCAIFKHPAFQWIACVALAIWVCFMLADVIRPRLKKREKAATPTAKWTEKDAMPAPENAETDETRLSLLRQVNHRIMEQLKQSYPMVSWLWWEGRPTTEEISKGCTRRIKLYNCDPFNFGEVTIALSGKLEIALIQLVPLTDAAQQPGADEDLEAEDILDRSDVKKWYTTTGVVLLSELIDELNVQGHKKLKIKETGEVYIVAGGTQQVVETIPDFPPRLAWEDLCILAREDEIHAEVCDQELAVSWS